MLGPHRHHTTLSAGGKKRALERFPSRRRCRVAREFLLAAVGHQASQLALAASRIEASIGAAGRLGPFIDARQRSRLQASQGRSARAPNRRTALSQPARTGARQGRLRSPAARRRDSSRRNTQKADRPARGPKRAAAARAAPPVDSDAKCNPVDSIGSSTKSRVSHSEPPPSARFPRDKDGSARRNIEPLQ